MVQGPITADSEPRDSPYDLTRIVRDLPVEIGGSYSSLGVRRGLDGTIYIDPLGGDIRSLTSGPGAITIEDGGPMDRQLFRSNGYRFSMKFGPYPILPSPAAASA